MEPFLERNDKNIKKTVLDTRLPFPYSTPFQVAPCQKFPIELVLIPLAIAMIPAALCALLICTCCCGPEESRGTVDRWGTVAILGYGTIVV